MEWAPSDILHKQFRTCWRGVDPQEVELFLQQVSEEMQRLQVENAGLRKDFQKLDKELKEHKEREKVIRNVLINAQKTSEQLKANAEKEAKLLVADAEIRAEKIVQGAQQRAARFQEEIEELKSLRIQLQMKLRTTIETYRQILDAEKEVDTEGGSEDKVRLVNR